MAVTQVRSLVWKFPPALGIAKKKKKEGKQKKKGLLQLQWVHLDNPGQSSCSFGLVK